MDTFIDMDFMLGHWIAENWAAIAIVVTTVSLLVFLVWLLSYYVRICLNIFCDTPLPLSMNPADFERIEGELVNFRSYDGISLRGMHLCHPEESPYKGTIVFCHEFGSDMYSCGRYVRPLYEAGYDIFTFDFRAHGQSYHDDNYKPLQWPSDKELCDVLGACAYVENCLTSEGKSAGIGLFGISRGAGSALLAAATDSNIKAIVCDSAFSSETTLLAYMKRWVNIFATVKVVYENHPEAFWRFMQVLVLKCAQCKMKRRFPSVCKALRDMQPRPVFFIHGKRDSYIRVDQSKILHGQAPEPKFLWAVDKAKHNQAVVIQPQKYASRTINFFDKYLCGRQDISDDDIVPGRIEWEGKNGTIPERFEEEC
ncbi:MAG TPA: alpha/beta hydrolase [Phycisphaerae bacterium]|mgnify:CR=1 FL=1|nr:alpha/beta hydrolase [Phycisphaerae bacterium]HPS52792.1 alpha/beta hydrolase [Phycisphaerae bacterium]